MCVATGHIAFIVREQGELELVLGSLSPIWPRAPAYGAVPPTFIQSGPTHFS